MDKLQPIFDFLWKVVDKYGTKSLVACAAIYAIYRLLTDPVINPQYVPYAVVTIGLIAVAYMVVREMQERRQVGNGKPSDPPPSDQTVTP